MAKMTHEIKVMRYIAEHGSITVRQALVDLWINSPTKVFSDMRKKGIPLVDRTVSKDGLKVYTIEPRKKDSHDRH